MKVWGQLKAIWDNAGQLVELREIVEEVVGQLESMKADITRLDERTRKQVYRAEKRAEELQPETQLGHIALGERVEILRAARRKGVL